MECESPVCPGAYSHYDYDHATEVAFGEPADDPMNMELGSSFEGEND